MQVDLKPEAAPPPPPPPPGGDGDPLPPTPPNGTEGGGGGKGCKVKNVIVIVVNGGEFDMGTDWSEPLDTQTFAYHLFKGIGTSQYESVGIVNAGDLPYLEQENKLIEAGEIDPGTAVRYLKYGGWSLGYSVSVTEHLSGDPSSPNSVGTVTVTVKDAQGNVVFTNQVTSPPGWVFDGERVVSDFYPLEEQASGNLNAFFNSVITPSEDGDPCP